MAYAKQEDQRAFQLQWVQGRRRAWLEANGPCQRCGSDTNLRPFAPSRTVRKNVWNLRTDKMEAELKDCIVLCASCHRIASLKRGKQSNVLALPTPKSDQILVKQGQQIVITITIDVP